MADTIQIRRGVKDSLPTLKVGEFGLCTDTKELFIGLGEKNLPVTANFETDDTLVFRDGVLRVNTTASVEADNTLPVTSAAVHVTVGNIEALLETI